MSTESREPADELRAELEPNILPRQLLALQQVAGRLSGGRPAPTPEYRAQLDARVREMAKQARVTAPVSWRLPGAILFGSGLGLLVLVAILVAAGAPGGR